MLVESGKLFVGSIASSTTREDLLRLFVPFGPVSEVVILAERDGRPKFSAFVNMRRRSDALRAISALDRALTLPHAKKILEVRFASPSASCRTGVPSGASTAASDEEDRSCEEESSECAAFDEKRSSLALQFRVQIQDAAHSVVECASAFDAVILWLELIETGAKLLPVSLDC